jgi:hypothetical protein
MAEGVGDAGELGVGEGVASTAAAGVAEATRTAEIISAAMRFRKVLWFRLLGWDIPQPY